MRCLFHRRTAPGSHTATQTNCWGCRCDALSIQPDCREVLVDVVARADPEAFHVAAVRHDAIAPQQECLMRFGIEDALFELPHQRALLREIRLAQHPVRSEEHTSE